MHVQSHHCSICFTASPFLKTPRCSIAEQDFLGNRSPACSATSCLLLAIVEDASPEVLESMEDAANIHDEEC